MSDEYTVISRSRGATGMMYPPQGLTLAYDVDDFQNGSDTKGSGVADFARNGSIGKGWTQIESLGTNGWTELGVADTEADQANHPGILYLTAAEDTVDSMVRISKPVGNNATNSVLSIAKTFHWRAVVNAYQIQSGVGAANVSMNQMFGLAANNITNVDPSGVSFAYLRSAGTPHTQWHLVTGQPFVGGDNTSSGITVDTIYHLFEILHVGGSTLYTFKIDGATVGALTYDFEADLGTQLIIPYFSLLEDSAGTTEKYMAVDYYDMLTTGLSRYTPA